MRVSDGVSLHYGAVKSFFVKRCGLRSLVKRRMVFDFIKAQRCSICFIQEAHLRDNSDAQRYRREWGVGPSVWIVGRVRSSGVGIVFGDACAVIEECFVVVQGRVVGVDVDVRGLKLG